MDIAEIAPTKTNLLQYRDQLDFSLEGHALLEQKREVLVMHLLDVISKITEHRERLNELLRNSYQLLQLLEIEIGEFELLRVIKGIRTGFEIDLMERTIMGVNIPTIRRRKARTVIDRPVVSISSTTLTFDQISKAIAEIIELLLIVAQVEVSAWRLAYEIKKTQRRVNALENSVIPQLKEVVKYIQDTLEERERETFFQMKRIKNAKIENVQE